MTTRKIILLFLLLFVFIGLTSVTFAQEINLDDMSSEQLNALLQALTEKLGQGEAPTGEEPDIEVPASADPAAPEEAEETVITDSDLQPTEKHVGPVKEAKKYQIYENKKLIIGRMPDSMFIRKPVGGGGSEEEETEPEDPKTLEEIHNCPPGATYECYTDQWGWEHCGCGYG